MIQYDIKKKVLPIVVKFLVGIGIGLIVLVLTGGWIVDIPFLKEIDLLTIDLRYQGKYEKIKDERDIKDESDVVIVSIGDDDLKALVDPFPFPRNYYAHLVENLNKAGTRVIVFDITFDTQGKTALGDSIFRETLKKYNNVIF